MKILIIKMTSMGDIIHTFPALTDAKKVNPAIQFDWIVEENFAEIPYWHPAVRQVFPVAFRRWRKNLLTTATYKEIIKIGKQVRQEKYDLVIDAQGLFKSSIVCACVRGKRVGFDRRSARESWGNFIYQQTFSVTRKQHAITRTRQLFAKSLNYEISMMPLDYGLDRQRFNSMQDKYLVFIPNTTWITKHWPEKYWDELFVLASEANWNIKIPWGNEKELMRAKRFASFSPLVEVLPKLDLEQVTKIIAGAKGIVALDTGLAHIAAALSVPTVSIYGATNPAFTGALGLNQKHLAASFPCAPCLQRQCAYDGESEVFPACYASITPQLAWEEINTMMQK